MWCTNSFHWFGISVFMAPEQSAGVGGPCHLQFVCVQQWHAGVRLDQQWWRTTARKNHHTLQRIRPAVKRSEEINNIMIMENDKERKWIRFNPQCVLLIEGDQSSVFVRFFLPAFLFLQRRLQTGQLCQMLQTDRIEPRFCGERERNSWVQRSKGETIEKRC